MSHYNSSLAVEELETEVRLDLVPLEHGLKFGYSVVVPLKLPEVVKVSGVISVSF